jgi:hypothetical protein
MDPLSIAFGLAQFVPGLVRWISGDDKSKAAQYAQTAIDVAKSVTGKGDGQEALVAIQANPELASKMQLAMQEHERAWWQEETKRLSEINATIRTELTSGDAYVRRMRPTWGYAMCVAFTTQMLAVTYSIIIEPQYTAEIVTALGSLSIIWSVGLSVLGVYVWKRSDEKQANAPGASRTRPLGAGLLNAVGALRGGK